MSVKDEKHRPPGAILGNPDTDIAIVGMACTFPKARDLQSYWQNIMDRVNAIADPPAEWEPDLFLDADLQGDNDRIYCARGGYLGELSQFNPMEHGVMPNSVDGTEPDHFMALQAARQALDDAGYLDQSVNRERTEVIIGRGTYVNRGNTTVIQHGLVVNQVLRILKQLHPEHTKEELLTIKKELKSSLPPFHAETAAGLVPNIISGRIANRLDLMGANYIIDAACASSLIAVDLGMQDLITGRCDLAVVGGVHASTPPPIVMIFCQLNAISHKGEMRPFDEHADGTILGEGPGTFLGDIAQGTGEEVVKARGFRSIAVYKNKLFVTASDFRGVGFIIVSENPKAGNDAWQRASPPADELPVWTLKIFNNFLYCTTGDRRDRVGYGVYKTDAAGDPPFEFTPIVTNGGFQVDALRSPDALSLEEFQDHLYVGSDRPPELIRIDRDDNWELVVGHPRQTPDGYKAPISGIGQWFGNLFIGHFWRMQAFNNQLFLGTWDWSESFRTFPVADPITRREYGTDVFTTRDGVHWSVVTKSGFGNPFNYGTRSFEVTPFGMFLGTAKGEGGGEVFLNQSNLDFDGDGDIDQNDVDTVLAARNQLATGPEDQRDLDRDGKITILDVRKMVLMCSQPDCEVVTPELVKLPPPLSKPEGSQLV